MRRSNNKTPEGRWTEEGRMIAELIHARFDSQSEFAKIAGESAFVVSNICLGKTRLKGERRRKFARLLNVSESDLIIPTVDDFQLLVNKPAGTQNLGSKVPV